MLLKILVPTAHKTHCVLVTNTSRFTLFREIMAIHSENYMEHINTIRGPKNDLPSYTITILIQTQMLLTRFLLSVVHIDYDNI
jgi:hypothetical protein